MDNPNKIDSFEKFIAWQETLPGSHRFTAAPVSTRLTPRQPLVTRAAGNVWTTPYAIAAAWRGTAASESAAYIEDLLDAPTRWWLAREVLRFSLPDGHKDQYEALPPAIVPHLTNNSSIPLNPLHFVRLNKQDRTQVDFVFTPEDGLRDKVTTMAFGRYLVKFLPWLRSSAVQELERMLRSQVSDEFDVFMGGHAIVKYYNNGPHSCMVFPEKQWGGDIKNHVLMTYDAPGWGIAIIAQDEAKSRASARALVWHNPADESDKRYIRVYGDTALEARLKRKGYVNKMPAPALLKYVPDVTSPGHLVMPYIDHTNYNSGGDGGWIFMDTDAPIMLTRNAWSKKRAEPGMYEYCIQQHHNSLRVRDKRFPGYRCVHCGLKIEGEARASLKPVFNGAACGTCYSEQDYISCYDGAQIVLRPRAQVVFLASGSAVYLTAETIKAQSLVKLDPLYYGDNGYTKRVIGMVKAPNGYFWNRKDTASLLSMDAAHGITVTYFNMLDNAWDPSDKWIHVSPRTLNEVLYVDKTLASSIVNVGKGRKIIPGIHKSYQINALKHDEAIHERDSTPRQAVNVFGCVRYVSPPKLGWYNNVFIALQTKLYPSEVQGILEDMSDNRDSFAQAARCAQYSTSGSMFLTNSIQGDTLSLKSVTHATEDEMAESLRMLLDRPIDELYFAHYQQFVTKPLTDVERAAIIGLRNIWTQVRTAWFERQKILTKESTAREAIPA